MTAGTIPATVAAGPVAVADQTKLDEQVGLTLTLAYTAAAKAATLAIQTGLIKDQATIARIGQLNTRAFNAVTAVRNAYLAGNSSSYLVGLVQGREAVADLLAAVTGKPVAMRRTTGGSASVAPSSTLATGGALV